MDIKMIKTKILVLFKPKCHICLHAYHCLLVLLLIRQHICEGIICTMCVLLGREVLVANRSAVSLSQRQLGTVGGWEALLSSADSTIYAVQTIFVSSFGYVFQWKPVDLTIFQKFQFFGPKMGPFCTWCQIVRCQIVMVSNYMASNCPWCQIVRCNIVRCHINCGVNCPWCQIVGVERNT